MFKPENDTNNQKWELEKQKKKPPQLYMAPLIYDRRSQKPHTILPMHRLFNQNVHHRSIGFNVKGEIQFVFMTTFGFEDEVLTPLLSTGCKLLLVNQFKDAKWTYQ